MYLEKVPLKHQDTNKIYVYNWLNESYKIKYTYLNIY